MWLHSYTIGTLSCQRSPYQCQSGASRSEAPRRGRQTRQFQGQGASCSFEFGWEGNALHGTRSLERVVVIDSTPPCLRSHHQIHNQIPEESLMTSIIMHRKPSLVEEATESRRIPRCSEWCGGVPS